MTGGEHLGLALALAGVLVLAFAFVAQSRRIDRLQRTVTCLQHPSHAISAVGPVGLVGPVGGRQATSALLVCP